MNWETLYPNARPFVQQPTLPGPASIEGTSSVAKSTPVIDNGDGPANPATQTGSPSAAPQTLDHLERQNKAQKQPLVDAENISEGGENPEDDDFLKELSANIGDKQIKDTKLAIVQTKQQAIKAGKQAVQTQKQAVQTQEAAAGETQQAIQSAQQAIQSAQQDIKTQAKARAENKDEYEQHREKLEAFNSQIQEAKKSGEALNMNSETLLNAIESYKVLANNQALVGLKLTDTDSKKLLDFTSDSLIKLKPQLLKDLDTAIASMQRPDSKATKEDIDKAKLLRDRVADIKTGEDFMKLVEEKDPVAMAALEATLKKTRYDKGGNPYFDKEGQEYFNESVTTGLIPDSKDREFYLNILSRYNPESLVRLYGTKDVQTLVERTQAIFKGFSQELQAKAAQDWKQFKEDAGYPNGDPSAKKQEFGSSSAKEDHNNKKSEVKHAGEVKEQKKHAEEKHKAAIVKIVKGLIGTINTQAQAMFEAKGHITPQDLQAIFGSPSQWSEKAQNYYLGLGILKKNRDNKIVFANEYQPGEENKKIPFLAGDLNRFFSDEHTSA